MTRTSQAATTINDLVIANRILANEDIVDAYGHVSARSPDNAGTFFIARSLAPELVGEDDIVELNLDGEPVDPGEHRPLYLERFIHAAIYKARPDAQAAVHAHAESTLPFGLTSGTPLRPVIHSGSFIGPHVPVWDIADKFGDTDLLVSNIEQGEDLAQVLADNNVVLMRGHGFSAAGRSIVDVVRISIYLARNATALTTTLMLGGEIKSLSLGEIAARNSAKYGPQSVATWRAWEYWATKCGCGARLRMPDFGAKGAGDPPGPADQAGARQ